MGRTVHPPLGEDGDGIDLTLADLVRGLEDPADAKPLDLFLPPLGEHLGDAHFRHCRMSLEERGETAGLTARAADTDPESHAGPPVTQTTRRQL